MSAHTDVSVGVRTDAPAPHFVQLKSRREEYLMQPRVSQDCIFAVIDVAPWDQLNPLSRLDKACASYFRSRRDTILAKWSRLNGCSSLDAHPTSNFAHFLLPNMLQHGRAILRDPTGSRFVVTFELGRPMSWSHEKAVDMDPPVWQISSAGMFAPIRGHAITASGLMFTEVVRGMVVRTTIIGDGRCAIRVGNLTQLITVSGPMPDASKWVQLMVKHNIWYDFHISRHVDQLVGDGNASKAPSFASVFARQGEHRIDWFNQCYPALSAAALGTQSPGRRQGLRPVTDPIC